MSDLFTRLFLGLSYRYCSPKFPFAQHLLLYAFIICLPTTPTLPIHPSLTSSLLLLLFLPPLGSWPSTPSSWHHLFESSLSLSGSCSDNGISSSWIHFRYFLLIGVRLVFDGGIYFFLRFFKRPGDIKLQLHTQNLFPDIFCPCVLCVVCHQAVTFCLSFATDHIPSPPQYGQAVQQLLCKWL